MSTFVKKYPRALVRKQPQSNGWTIDLIQRAGVKPKRVAATYAGITWAHKAARAKLGLPSLTETTTTSPAPKLDTPITLPTPGQIEAAARAKHTKDYGTCGTCHRPMRPAGSKSADYPGTTLRQREGLCQTCNIKAFRKAKTA